jgi:TusA-related sulfurtransferase
VDDACPVEGSAEGALVVDCRGMLCPLPIIELGKVFATTRPGQLMTLVSDDPAAAVDVAAWCRMRGQPLVARSVYTSATSGEPATAYTIRHG